MLNRFYYLNNDVNAGGAARRIAVDAGITVAHFIECGSTAHNQTVPAAGCDRSAVKRLLDYQYSQDGNFSFCLGLHGSAKNVAAKAHQSLLFFFHPFYETAENGKPLFVFTPVDQQESARVQLAELFHRQRVTVEFIIVDPETLQSGTQLRDDGIARKADGGKRVIALEPAEQYQTGESPVVANPARDYYQYCLTAYQQADIFLLKGSAIGSLIADLERVNQKLLQQHADFHELASEVREMRGKLSELSRRNSSVREENAILSELLELSAKHNEVDDILRFYKNEYEILPLWYKRFGHILKVMQGKRSFRSLYDKRVKKYKD
jgi:hypothetical protein